jgi:hypothetical protein
MTVCVGFPQPRSNSLSAARARAAGVAIAHHVNKRVKGFLGVRLSQFHQLHVDLWSAARVTTFTLLKWSTDHLSSAVCVLLAARRPDDVGH